MLRLLPHQSPLLLLPECVPQSREGPYLLGKDNSRHRNLVTFHHLDEGRKIVPLES